SHERCSSLSWSWWNTVLVFFLSSLSIVFFFNDAATTEIYTLSLHDALPICPVAVVHGAVREFRRGGRRGARQGAGRHLAASAHRSEEHTSELQSPCNLVCRLLLEKKKKNKTQDLRL